MKAYRSAKLGIHLLVTLEYANSCNTSKNIIWLIYPTLCIWHKNSRWEINEKYKPRDDEFVSASLEILEGRHEQLLNSFQITGITRHTATNPRIAHLNEI